MTPEQYARFASDLLVAFTGKGFSVTVANELTREVLRGVAGEVGVETSYRIGIRS